MNAAQALAFITARLHPEADPVLDVAELVELLDEARAEDDDGNKPTDAEWTPTYSKVGCYRAIAEGWTMKHGKAVGRFEFTTDGQTFRRQQTLDHCEEQRRRWQAKVQSSPSTLGSS